MKHLLIIPFLLLIACDDDDLNGILEQEAISRVFANDLFLGEYSGPVTDFDSNFPCPNNNVIVSFDFEESGDQRVMNFSDIAGNINEPILTVDTFENEGDFIALSASGSGNGQTYELEGRLQFEDFDELGISKFQFVGDFDVTQGASECSFEITSDSRDFDQDSL